MAIHFDTLQCFERLKRAGMPEAQAKAQVEALACALDESLSNTLATKTDIASLKADISSLKADIVSSGSRWDASFSAIESDMALLKWMLAVLILCTLIELLLRQAG